jgi:tetratricopeptide (TPR) repeat protein
VQALRFAPLKNKKVSMSFGIIPNILIILSIVGILILFLRRLPEVVEEQGQLKIGSGVAFEEETRLGFQQLLKAASEKISIALKKFFSRIWSFALEAKDIQQGNPLAGKFRQMVSSKRKVINIGVQNSLKKADRQLEQGYLEAAEETYFEIIKKHPHEYNAYEGLVKIYSEQKKYEDIVEILEFLLAHNQTNDGYYAKLGSALLSLRKYPAAIAAYQKSLEFNDKIPARYINIGLCYKAMHKPEQAIGYFGKGVDLEPENRQYRNMLLDALVKAKRKDEARARVEEALTQNPEDSEFKARLAEIEKM